MGTAINGIFTKEDVIGGVKWFSSKKNCAISEADVTISKHKYGYGFIFRNGCEKKLGAAHGRIEFGFIRPGVIAFRSSPNGYKLGKRPDGTSGMNSKYVTLKNPKGKTDMFKDLEAYIGNYDLEYDKNFGLCYINTENRK